MRSGWSGCCARWRRRSPVSRTRRRCWSGTGQDQVHLLIAVTADRGLAGAFNSSIGRATRNLARRLEAEGKTVKILAVGRKGRDYLRRELCSRIVGDICYAGKRRIEFADAQEHRRSASRRCWRPASSTSRR